MARNHQCSNWKVRINFMGQSRAHDSRRRNHHAPKVSIA